MDSLSLPVRREENNLGRVGGGIWVGGGRGDGERIWGKEKGKGEGREGGAGRTVSEMLLAFFS